jgi:Zn-dependent peptidase ImmA (M78 family)
LSELMESVHWYLLPLLEWFIDNWNPLFHEERMPTTGYSTAVEAGAGRPIVDPEGDDGVAHQWWMWWMRHALWASRAGGPFPNIFIRRWRDKEELSWNWRRASGIPDEVRFLSPNGFARILAEDVARPTYAVIHAALAELHDRLPDSRRIKELAERAASLLVDDEDDAYRERFGWLSGFSGLTDRFAELWTKAEEQLQTVQSEVMSQIRGQMDRRDVIIPGTPYAAVLFGSLSPTVTDEDVISITRLLVQNASSSPHRDDGLVSWRDDVELDELDLAPWEQGNVLADQILDYLEINPVRYVDIRGVLDTFKVRVFDSALSDKGIRSIAVAGPYQHTTVFVNKRFRYGTSDAAVRFSLAHELCHLLVDQDKASRLAVASGPWAPLDIEQRANAFAAAFLLPEAAIKASLRRSTLPITRMNTISRIAETYGVSRLTVIDRLYNLGLIERDVREELRATATVKFSERSEAY